MYSSEFCKVYNIFGWNYYPEAFGEQLLLWLNENGIHPKNSMDLACGTGILCGILQEQGIDASGMDFSEGMIEIARTNYPGLTFDVADMIQYRPDKQYDLVTCTGDALNHIHDLKNVRRIFENVYAYLSDSGLFVFDILNENEVSEDEPFDLDFSETVRAQFQMKKSADGMVTLSVRVYENGDFQFQEDIREQIHDPAIICQLLSDCGFSVIKCSNKLPDSGDYRSTTNYIIAKKQAELLACFL